MFRAAALLCFGLPSPILLAGPPHRVTPADYAAVSAVTGFAISPDGKQLAFCEARWQVETDDRKADVWVVALTGDAPPRRLTFDRANDRLPVWSADGRTVFALGNRKREGEKRPP